MFCHLYKCAHNCNMKGEYAKNKLPLNHEIEGDLSILAQHPNYKTRCIRWKLLVDVGSSGQCYPLVHLKSGLKHKIQFAYINKN